MTLEQAVDAQNRFVVGFDMVLRGATLLAPEATLRVLGYAVAAMRGRREDWWVLAWLRATEIATDTVWVRSPVLRRPGVARSRPRPGSPTSP